MKQGHASAGLGVGGIAGLLGLAMALAGSLLFWASEGAAIFAGAVVTSFLNCF